MGKAADRRRAARAQYLANLAETAPDKFREEWWKRVNSWADEAWKRAGTLDGPSAFGVLAEAQQTLDSCLQARGTHDAVKSIDALTYECTKAISVNADTSGYRLVQVLKKKP